eukprot:3319944-Pleurochrysis_carterae.AAC.3
MPTFAHGRGLWRVFPSGRVCSRRSDHACFEFARSLDQTELLSSACKRSRKHVVRTIDSKIKTGTARYGGAARNGTRPC